VVDRLQRHLSFAKVVSVIALFVALGGTVYATTLAPPNSVNSRAIINGQAKIADVRNVVDRARGSGSVSTGDGGFGSPVNYPLTKARWTQAPSEVDMVTGQVTYTTPATCGGLTGGLGVRVRVNGKEIGSSLNSFGFDPAATTVTRQLLASPSSIFEPGSARTRTLSAKIYDSCDTAGQNYTVKAVKLDVIAVR
jgi:hypothetical protein